MSNIKRVLTLGALVVCSAFRVHAVDPIFINYGTLTNVPQIDALTFANLGLFSVSSVLPYETQNTLNFTNTGQMIGSPGFRFQLISADNARRPAANFFNGLDAGISAGAVGGGFIGGGGPGGPGGSGGGFSPENTQIIISATNVVNQGRLLTDGNGLVHIDGSSVNLTRSSLGSLPFSGGGFETETNFVNDSGIFDVYWGMNNDVTMNPPQMNVGSLARANRGSTNFSVTTPQHTVTNRLRFLRTARALTNAVSFVVTNAVTPTNWIVQAVFVQVNDPELAVDARFAPSTISTNPYATPIVEIKHPETNVLDATPFLTTIYIQDRIASETNFLLLTNLQVRGTYRPSTYGVSRQQPPAWLNGAKANAKASTNAAAFLSGPTYSNMMVTNVYSAYAMNVTNIAYVLPQVEGASLTNLPGRVELVANDLNLSKTRIRGEGIVTIKANNLTGTNAIIDAQNLAFDLKSSTGNLLVQGLSKDLIQRTAGPIYMWSAIWTNQTGFTVTNSIPDPNNPGGMTNEVVTNVVDVGFHVMVVDSAAVLTRLPVFVSSFRAVADQVTISDTVRIVETALVDTESLTVSKSGKLLLTNAIQNFDTSIFPRLRTLVNDGVIRVPGTLNVGVDPSPPFVSIINHGMIHTNGVVTNGIMTAFNAAFRTALFENSGAIIADPGAGIINLEAQTPSHNGQVNLLDHGNFTAAGEIRIFADNLTMRNYAITNRQALTLSIPGSLKDGGKGTTNTILTEGFHLLDKPASGDLLATTIESVAPRLLAIPHTWPGEDRGPSKNGYINNTALGRLVLNGDFESVHVFRGLGLNRALYVDYLEFKGAIKSTNDVPNALDIQPGFTVYFAQSNFNTDALNGMFGGRLVWVRDFIGLNSGVTVTSPSGQTILMNQALRESLTIDSDGDGIVNALDPDPLGSDSTPSPVLLSDVGLTDSPPVIRFSWRASPNGVYRVEYNASLSPQGWQLLTRYTNSAPTGRIATVIDAISSNRQRYYRVLPNQ